MKTKQEILKEKFEGAHPSHYLGLIRTEWKMEAIYSAMEDYAQMKVNELNKSDVIKSLPADWKFLINDLLLFVEKNGDVCNGFRSRETILEMKKKIEAGNVL